MSSEGDQNVQFCRVCFVKEETEFIDILENQIIQMELLSVGNIEVFEGDGLPNVVCTRCKIILSNAYKFKTVCKRADTLLKMYPITKTIPPKINIAQEPLPAAETEKVEEKPPATEFCSIGVNVDYEIKESSTQTDPVVEIQPVSLEQMEMIVDYGNLEPLPSNIPPPPQEFMDAEIIYAEEQPQFEVVAEESPQKPKVYEKMKILNKGTSDKFPLQAKQFKKPQNPMKIEKIINSKPKILNNELLTQKIAEPETEEIQIITYENAEYLDEIAPQKLIDDKSEDGVVYTCDVCERSFPLLQQLEIHKKNHERPRHFPCEYCEKAFFSKYDLGKHILTHTKQKDYTCIVCDKSFSRSTLLYRHEKIHTDPSIPRYQCDQCDRCYLNKLDYEKHQLNHSKDRPFACKHCNKRFAFKQGLERHEVNHDRDSMPHGCQYCSERFTTPAKLQRHLSSAHAGTRAFPCSKCNKRFMLSHHLYRHMRTSHQDENETYVYQCPVCESSYINRDEFFDHCLEHATETLICPLCNYEATDIENVNQHISNHSKLVMYYCDYCPCIFTSQDILNEHLIEKHSNELCAIEDEIESNIEPNITSSSKRDKRKAESSTGAAAKRIKEENVAYENSLDISEAAFIEYEEIQEEIKEEPRKKASSLRIEKPQGETIQRIKMSRSEINRLKKEGKIVMENGVLVMKE